MNDGIHFGGYFPRNDEIYVGARFRCDNGIHGGGMLRSWRWNDGIGGLMWVLALERRDPCWWVVSVWLF